jgi:WD repeat-containing protein 68
MSFHENSDPYRSNNHNEVFDYKTPWQTYAFSFSDRIGCFLLGSYIESYQNQIELLTYSSESNKIIKLTSADHFYPPTKIMWSPVQTTSHPLFASISDCLRIWRVDSEKLEITSNLLPHQENKDYNGPLTSFDWSSKDPSTLGTSSIDKTCTIWDLNKNAIKKQILAHNSEVNDIAFSQDPNIFVTASTDFSVRKFDLRSLEQCSIIYENPRQQFVARVAWNKVDPNYLAILSVDSNTIALLDIRTQIYPILEIKGHNVGINSMCWATGTGQICTASEDNQVLIRDAIKSANGAKDIPLVYNAPEKVYSVYWSPFNEIGMVQNCGLQYIRL